MSKPTQTIENAPVILFTYNRVNVLKKTIEALSKNLEIEKTDLFIFSDGPKIDNINDTFKVNEVREYLKTIKKFAKSVSYYEQKINIGLAESITIGITEVTKQYKNFIVLEDDLVTSKYFINYMNQSLIKYEKNLKVWSINGMGINKSLLEFPDSYPYNSYFTYRSSSHGWGSWSNRWSQVSWETNHIIKEIFKFNNYRNFLKGGRDLREVLIQQINHNNDSWWIKWHCTVSKNGGISLAPKYSHVSAQTDSGGTHIREYMAILDNDLSSSHKDISFPDREVVNSEIAKELSSLFVSKYASNIKTPKIFIVEKNLFISFLEYLVFITKYFEAKYTIKAKRHKIKGFIKHHLGKK
jgi:hypothetical protein